MDGWDTTVKVSALATVLMDYPLKPNDIQSDSIRGLSMEQVQSAKMTLAPALAAGAPSPAVRWAGSAGVGRPYKLVCQAEMQLDGTVVGSVRPEQVLLR